MTSSVAAIRPVPGTLRISWGAFTVLLSTGCVLPTERGTEVRAQVDVISDLIRGEVARLTGRVVDASGALVPNSAVRFTSSDTRVVSVAGDTLLAVDSGTVTITATVVGYDGAAPATRTVRVHDEVEIDSIRPRQRKWGEDLVIYGTGIADSSLFFVLVGNVAASVKSYVPNDPARRNRFGRLTVWVPPPAGAKSRVTILGIGGLRVSPDTAAVAQFDLYEPNDVTPALLGPIPAGLFNPALAFEPKIRNEPGADWYRFTNTAALDRTIILRSAGVQPETIFLSDALSFDVGTRKFTIGPQSWTIGPGLYACKGVAFAPDQLASDSFVVALKGLPARTYDLIAGYTTPGPYGMLVESKYRSVLPPDSHEEDDYCDAGPVTTAPLVLGSSRSLTIDNPGEVDWFQFSVPAALGPAGETVAFTVAADSAAADLDLYVLRAPPAAVAAVDSSAATGTLDNLVVSVTPGTYYLVVMDFAGVPTHYTLTSSVVSVPAPPRGPSGARERRSPGRGSGARAVPLGGFAP